ncbi:MAG: enoyl-CoA hydratase/isomerase family protein [Polyangiaceae bacterium]
MIREARVALDDALDGPAAAVLTLARPEKKNALSSEMVAALVDAAHRADADARVRALVLAADGDVFAAGGDLDEIAAALASPAGANEIISVGARLRALEELDVPVLMALSGDVYGGGCELTLLADVVVLEEHARLSFRHARMGLAPAWGGTARLLERVGPTVAARMLFTSERIDARTAERTGLVTEVVASGKSAERCVAIAREIAKASRSTITAQKRGLSLARAAMRSAREAAEAEAQVFQGLFGGAAHLAAMKVMGR